MSQKRRKQFQEGQATAAEIFQQDNRVMKGECRQSESRGKVCGTRKNGQYRLYFGETWVRWVRVSKCAFIPPRDRTGLL